MKVSVIVPSYNYGHFISETLSSVLKQTDKDWECIIVDDCSPDNTREIVQKYIKHDCGFKYQNLGGPILFGQKFAMFKLQLSLFTLATFVKINIPSAGVL